MKTRIKELRMEARMSQLQLSLALEISQETVSAYEKGKHYPSVRTLAKMSDIFSASCDYILYISDIRCPYSYDRLGNTEQIIVETFRKLPDQKKAQIQEFMNGLSIK